MFLGNYVNKRRQFTIVTIDGYLSISSGKNECVKKQNEHFNVCMHNGHA